MLDISSKNKSANDNEDEEGQDEDETLFNDPKFDFKLYDGMLIYSGNYFDLFYF